MSKAFLFIGSVLLLISVGTVAAQSDDDYAITRSTIDTGAVVNASGEGYTMSAVAGQHDATSASGGQYQLTGGFWYAVGSVPTSVVTLTEHQTTYPPMPTLSVILLLLGTLLLMWQRQQVINRK